MRLYDGNGAVLPYEQIVVPMLFERLFGGVWEKSIEYFQKVYRVFSDRTIQTLRFLPSSALIVWEERGNGSGAVGVKVGRGRDEVRG